MHVIDVTGEVPEEPSGPLFSPRNLTAMRARSRRETFKRLKTKGKVALSAMEIKADGYPFLGRTPIHHQKRIARCARIYSINCP
jgi:hypothetical protein